MTEFSPKKKTLSKENRFIFFLPGTAAQSICVDLLGTLEEILSYGIGGLYARHGREYIDAL
jgi:hypothetical protein